MSRPLSWGVGICLVAAALSTACGGDEDAAAAPKKATGSGGSSGSGGTGSALPEPACERGACECNDGIDNDGDGLVDWQFDLGCTSRDDNSEGKNATGIVEDGWTVIEPGESSQVIYVSSSVGDDTFDGLSPEPDGSSGPKKTVNKALELIRDGQGDWVLLRRGDTFESGTVQLRWSGESQTNPFVLSSYGESTDFPILHGNIAGQRVNNVVVAHVGVTLAADSDEAHIGFQFANHLLIEGNRLEGGNTCVSSGADSPMSDWKIRRNVCIKPSNGGGYLTWIHDLLIEGNVYYRTAWKTDNHALYITRRGNENVTTRDNLILMDKDEESGDGIAQRPGGLSEGNVVVGASWQGINFGACNDGDEASCYPPVSVNIRGNLLLDGKKLGGGITAHRMYSQPGGQVTDNMLLNAGTESAPGFAASVQGLTAKGNIIYNVQAMLEEASDVTWEDNVFFSTQSRPHVLAESLPQCDGFVADQNRFFQTNQDPGAWFKIPQDAGFDGWQEATGETGSGDEFGFVDATRTLASYNASLGGENSREAFFVEASKQSKFAYREAYTAPAVIAYFREGFTIR